MVLELQFRNRLWIAYLIGLTFLGRGVAYGAETAEEYLRDAQVLYRSGRYYSAARYAFHAKELNPALSSEAYSWVTLSLIRSQLYQSASYFFIRTLQTGQKVAVQRVLTQTETLLSQVSPDLLRRYLIQYTHDGDYDPLNRSVYFYVLGKMSLVSGEISKAAEFFSGVDPKSFLYPEALQLRGSAYAISNRSDLAISDFKRCEEITSDEQEDESFDVHSRCLAGRARTLYQIENFEAADLVYDQISKASRVWPGILFEQAWNSFARGEYNRSLGKLVSYKSPALSFVFNPEIDVLRAQTYLALCLYKDANEAIEGYQERYESEGKGIKAFFEAHSQNLEDFYVAGERALSSSAASGVSWVLSAYVRGPYFMGLSDEQKMIRRELQIIRKPELQEFGFSRFLEKVLEWRAQSIRTLGGAYIKNGLLDYYDEIISNLDKISFIKLEMLKRAKNELIFKNRSSIQSGDRERGNVEPERRDYQYYWSFNGEFWNDELGDYIFGLESECKGGEGV